MTPWNDPSGADRRRLTGIIRAPSTADGSGGEMWMPGRGLSRCQRKYSRFERLSGLGGYSRAPLTTRPSASMTATPVICGVPVMRARRVRCISGPSARVMPPAFSNDRAVASTTSSTEWKARSVCCARASDRADRLASAPAMVVARCRQIS